MAEWVRHTQRETPKKISEGGDTVRSQCRLTDAGQTRSGMWRDVQSAFAAVGGQHFPRQVRPRVLWRLWGEGGVCEGLVFWEKMGISGRPRLPWF